MENIFIDPTAQCESRAIGDGTRIGPKSRISKNSKIGSWSELGEAVEIRGDVEIGNRASIASGVTLNGPLLIGDDVVIESGAVVGLEIFGDSPLPPLTRIHSGSVIGKNARIVSGVTIGQQALILEDSTVVNAIPDYGAAARQGVEPGKRGVTPTGSSVLHMSISSPPQATMSAIDGIAIVALHEATDSRGTLIALELEKKLPFVAKRFFHVSQVPEGEIRGVHAHRKCHQFIVPISGKFRVIVSDGESSEEYSLDSPSIGLYMPPLIWGTQHSFSKDAVVLVVASEAYDRAEYIHHWDEFIRLKKA